MFGLPYYFVIPFIFVYILSVYGSMFFGFLKVNFQKSKKNKIKGKDSVVFFPYFKKDRSIFNK